MSRLATSCLSSYSTGTVADGGDEATNMQRMSDETDDEEAGGGNGTAGNVDSGVSGGGSGKY